MRTMMKLIALIALVVSAAVGASPPSVMSIAGRYGTVAYSGAVVRSVDGDNYVFVVRTLTLTLVPDAKINSVGSIVNPELALVTTKMAPGAKRSSHTSRMSLPLHISLSRQHPTATVHNLRFSVPKDTVGDSTYTVLDLSDGHHLWPFASQLKPDGVDIPAPIHG